MLIGLIKTHALAAVEAGDWRAVAATINSLTHVVRVGKVGGKESLQAIVATGEDPNQVIGTMRAVPMASVLLDTLISSGVDWADPVTDLIMSGLVDKGLIKQTVADAVRRLSERIEAVFVESVTADMCRNAWNLSLKQAALDKVLSATEAAQAEYRKADSTPESIVAAAVAVLEDV